MSARGETVVIIPARYASSRFPGKPLATIAGKPMIVHVMERARRAALVDRVLVATDDARIAGAVRAAGGEAIMTPEDCRSGSDRIAVVARTLKDADIIVNVQGDEPLIPSAMIDEAVRPLRDDAAKEAGTLARSLRSVAEWEDPNVTKVLLDERGRCLWFSRAPIPAGRNFAPEEILRTCPVYAHVGLYVYRKAFLLAYAAMPQTPCERAEQLEQLRILEHGHTLHAVVTARESIAVDTPADLERARAACARMENERRDQTA